MSSEAEIQNHRDFLLQHSRTPQNQQDLSTHTHEGFCHNPACGDQVLCRLHIADEKVLDIQAKVQGCTIAIATSSLMSEFIKGKSSTELEQLITLFEKAIVSPPNTPWPSELTPLKSLSPLRNSRMRTPCALISWVSLKKALHFPEQ